MTRPKLVTIPPSHFCEKARWALQLAGYEFDEEGHAPLLHFFFTLPRTRTRTVPLLLRPGDAPLTDSTDILRFADSMLPADRKLYPDGVASEARELEEEFDATLGVSTRRLAYCYIARNKALFIQGFARGIPTMERSLVVAGERGMRAALGKVFKVSDRARDRTRAKVEEQFDRVGKLLADGRRYLVGDRFTAADLTFVALSGPVLFLSRPLEDFERADPGFAEVIRALRATPAGEFARRVHADHRRLS